MISLSVTDISTYSEAAKAPAKTSQDLSVFIGILLLLLLAFTTATVWVRQAWALQFFQIGIYTLLIVQVVSGFRRGTEQLAGGIPPLLVYFIPLWGVMQVVAHTTSSSFETREAVLRWGALAGVFYLSQTVTGSRLSRQRFLGAFLCFAAGMALLFLLQFNTSGGRVLWVFQTEYTDQIYATFQNKNNYVQFVELALPIALWRAVRQGWRSWWYVLACGLLYASAIGATSRAGFVLCSGELFAILILCLLQFRKGATKGTLRSAISIFLMVPVVAGAFTFAVGWQPIWQRFKESDPFAIRREYFLGAVEMAKHRPFTGYGLGTYEFVYQRYAIKDDAFFANYAHDDWAEFAAEGGIPFLLLVAIPFVVAVPSMFRHPWALGLVATMLNACVDYPFPRPAVSGWMFAILGALYMARKSGQPEN